MSNQTPLIVVIMLTVLACFLPFIPVGSVNLYISECIIYSAMPFLIFKRFRINWDIFVSYYLLIVVGLFHGIINNDVLTAIIPIRMFALFYATFILIQQLNNNTCQSAFKKALTVICLVYTFYIINTVFGLISGRVSVLEFLYNYELGRIKAFYENGTTSVVIGALLSLLFTIVLCSNNIDNRRLFLVTLFILGVFTASRANILANVTSLVAFHLMSKPNFSTRWFCGSVAVILVIIASLYIIMLKIILAGVQIDGSASTRIKYWLVAINSANSMFDVIFGHGFSERVLYAKFNISFFESFFVNLYMQAGLIGLFVGTYLINRIVLIYRLGARCNFTILSGLLLGNLVGGANLFSIFVLPFMLLGLSYLRTER